MAYRDAGNGPGHRAVLDMQIAGADTAQSHPNHRISGVKDRGLRLVHEGKFAVFNVGQGFHGVYLQFIWNYYSADFEEKLFFIDRIYDKAVKLRIENP
jgi:hypothetical protein